MIRYHKILNLKKRNPKGERDLLDEWASPEFDYLQDTLWNFSEKIDGMNIRIVYLNGSIEIGGRTSKAIIPPKLKEKIEKTIDLERMKGVLEICQKEYPNHFWENEMITFYAEGYGKKIQEPMGSKYNPKGNDFVVFDVLVGTNHWLPRGIAAMFVTNCRMNWIPCVGKGTLNDAIELVSKRGVQSALCDGIVKAEGLIVRPEVEIKDQFGKRIIGKIKDKDYKEPKVMDLLEQEQKYLEQASKKEKVNA